MARKKSTLSTKVSVFDRLSSDSAEAISTENEVNKSKTSLHGPQTASTESLPTLQLLSSSRSNLGKTILYGNVAQQRHLNMKVTEIEKLQVRHMRNMEWNQLNVFKQLAKERIDKEKGKENFVKRSKTEAVLKLPDLFSEKPANFKKCPTFRSDKPRSRDKLYLPDI